MGSGSQQEWLHEVIRLASTMKASTEIFFMGVRVEWGYEGDCIANFLILNVFKEEQHNKSIGNLQSESRLSTL